MKNNPRTAYVLLFWPAVIVVINFVFVRLKPINGASNTQLMYLVKTIDKIIGAKIDRFGFKAKQILADPDNADDGMIFQEITQPRQQIKMIVNGVWEYIRFHVNDPNIDIHVALARMGKDFIEEYEYYCPEGERPFSSVGELSVEQAGFSRAMKRGKILIVPDVEKEGKSNKPKRNFVLTTEDSVNNKGSLICFPIRHSDFGTPFVLSILVSVPGYFRLAHEDVWSLILDKFAKRIALEYGLLILKERKHGEKV